MRIASRRHKKSRGRDPDGAQGSGPVSYTHLIGDRMDTDIVAGIETGLDTLLVLSGVTTREEMTRFPYRPRLVLNGVGDIPPAE